MTAEAGTGRARLLHGYLTAVIVVGLADIAVAVRFEGPVVPDSNVGRYAVFAAIIVIGELFPVTFKFRNEHHDVTTSTSFAFAVLLMFGLAPTLLAQSIASIASDVRQRKTWWRALFNVSQYALAWTACWAVLRVSGVTRFDTAESFTSDGAVGLVAAAVVFMVVNYVFVAIAVALAQRYVVARNFVSSARIDLAISAVLFAMAPVVVIIGEQNLALVPLLLAPLAAVYQSARTSMEKLHQSMHDSLTNLPNRLYFEERVRQAIDERPDAKLDVLIVNIDSFSEINNTLGHHVGDILIVQVADRLRSAVPGDAVVSRLGSDEYAISLPAGSGHDARGLADLIQRSLEAPFVLDEVTFEVGASIGSASYPLHGNDVDTLIRRADSAMYEAKERRSGFEWFRPERDHRDARRLTVLAELRQGIDEGQLVLHFQPKAELPTGRILGAEALVRWNHPALGLLGPDSFVPLAEPTGLINSLTLHVLEQALEQCHRWSDEKRDLRVSVNVSVRNLYDERFVFDVDRILERTGVDPSRLTLEITESTMMADPTRPIAALAQLSLRGVQIAVDDFGTGYSSLAYLRRLPVTEIKIDKSFVLGMLDSPDDATIVRSTIDLVRNLGLIAVAEGVEREEVWNALIELGCHRAQGHYLTRPLAADAFTHWLDRYDPRAPGRQAPASRGLRAV